MKILTNNNLKELVSFKLPKQLNEISGLAFSKDGKLFAHNDEKSIIYQLDYSNGKIIKEFTVGKKTIRDDFEGLAIANDLFYFVTSNGDIYEFSEGDNGDEVKYEKYKTFLDSGNDVEGLCYDPNTNSLLLACKGNPGKKYKGNRAVYEFSLDDKKLMKKPRFVLSIKEIMENYKSDFRSKLGEFFLIKDDTFAPSGIEYNQRSENFFILSNKGRMIVEITVSGKIVGQYFLDPKKHDQPEGITFDNENRMIISDEAVDKKARITIYNIIQN